MVASGYFHLIPIALISGLLVQGRQGTGGRLMLVSETARPQNPGDAGGEEAAKKSPTFLMRLISGLGAAGGAPIAVFVEPLSLALTLVAVWLGAMAALMLFLDRRGR